MDSYKIIKVSIYSLLFLFSVIICNSFFQTIKYKKKYDKAIKIMPKIFHYPNELVKENPLQIVSQFRNNSYKTGILKPALDKVPDQLLKHTKPINGSLHGASKATPAVDASGIYIGADDGWFYKFNHDGQLIWKTYFSLSENGVHGTALLSKKYLWVGTYNGTLYCLEKESGKIVWSIDLGGAIGASPSFFKDKIIISVELLNPNMGYIAAVSIHDGQLIWKTSLTNAHIHSSVAINPKKAYGVVGANNGLLFKIDLFSGKILWIKDTKGAIKSTPLIHDKNIYVTNWSEHFYSFTENGKLNWKAPIQSHSQSSPTLIPSLDLLIFGTHNKKHQLIAVYLRTGKVKWKKNISNTRAIASGISFTQKNTGKPFLIYPCTMKDICIIRPTDGLTIKKINTGSLLTGSISYFNKQFYMSLNNGGVISLL